MSSDMNSTIANVPPGGSESEHDLLSNIDLATMNDFGLDRFIPVRQNGQQSGEHSIEGLQKDSSMEPPAGTAPSPIRETAAERPSRTNEEVSTAANPLKRVRIAREASENGSATDTGNHDDNVETGTNKRARTSTPGDSSYPEEQPEETQSPGQSPLGEEVSASTIASHAHLTPAEMLEVPINELTPEQRRERQKEGNRLAALRSRGKKRGELATLEQTVSAIRQENTKLRARLERLLANATTIPSAEPLVQPVASGSGTQPSNVSTGAMAIDLEPGVSVDLDSDGRQSGSRAEGSGDLEDLVVNGNGDNAGTHIASEVDAELGFSISTLKPLQTELAELRRRLRERNASRGQPAPPATDDDEKTALLAHVRYLREENERVERQKQTLQREINKRRLLLARKERSSEDESEEVDAGVGVERALLEVRGWLDEALQSWSSTGILQIPTQQASALPIPVPGPRKSTRPRKERSTRRTRVNGKDALAGDERPAEVDPVLPVVANQGNPPATRSEQPVGEVAVIDAALEAATASGPIDQIDAATDASQLEEAQAQQNLQRLLALYSASASANEPNRISNDERPEGDEAAEHARDGVDADVEMPDAGEGRPGEDAGDFLAYLARETRRSGVE